MALTLLRRTIAVLVAAVALAAGTSACSGREAVYEDVSGASVCLVPRGEAFRLEVEGLQPGSQLVFGGGEGESAGSPLVLTAGPDGKPPQGQALGLLPGDGPETVSLEGTSHTGTPFVATIRCDPPPDSGGRCTPTIES
jgi:hypothetical protein